MREGGVSLAWFLGLVVLLLFLFIPHFARLLRQWNWNSLELIILLLIALSQRPNASKSLRPSCLPFFLRNLVQIPPRMAPSLSIPSVLSTPTGKLIAVAVVSTSLTSLSILSFQALRRTKLRRSVKAEAEALAATDEGDDLSTLLSTNSNSNPNSTNRSNRPTNRPTTTGNKRKVSEHLIRESLARNYVYFGEEGMEKIRGSFVVIVGLGGVGSAAATMLVRSGVGRVRLIDFDQVSLSSLNVRRRSSFPFFTE